ncbi:hypothetical protein ACNF77_09015 [Campylobacter coli]
MYLHHIKTAPNKIIIKRLNLNNSANIEEELAKTNKYKKIKGKTMKTLEDIKAMSYQEKMN